MIQPISAQYFRTYLPEEQPEAKEGNATVFHVRRMTAIEGVEYDLLLEKARRDGATLDSTNQARLLVELEAAVLTDICNKIENHAEGKEPIIEPEKIKQYALETLTYQQMQELNLRAKTGFLLADTDAELVKNV